MNLSNFDKELRMKFTNHPKFDAMAQYYEDAYNLIEKGDTKTVKDLKEKYLPKLESQLEKGGYMGDKEYSVFLADAIWHNIPNDSLNDILGLMFEKTSTYDLPKKIEGLKDKITPDGQGLQMLEYITQIAQLTYGRVGLIASPVNDVKGTELPVVSVYDAPCIINWHTFEQGGNIYYDFVLIKTESYDWNSTTYEYEPVVYYTVHALTDAGNYFKVKLKQAEIEKYSKKLETHDSYVEPEYRGKKLKYVPFVAVNCTNTDGLIDNPPLYEMSMLSVQAYKSSALYQRKNKMQTWALLLLAGFEFDKKKSDGKVSTGIKADGFLRSKNPNARGMYVSPSADNMEAMKENLERIIAEAESRGVYLSQKNVAEASKALEIRSTGQSQSYRLLVKFRNEGIEKIIKIICEWGRVTIPTAMKLITPYDEFKAVSMEIKDVAILSTLVDNGKLPMQDLYRNLKKYGITGFEKYEDYELNLKNTIFEE